MTGSAVTIMLRPDQAAVFCQAWKQREPETRDAMAALERCRRAWERMQPQQPLDLYPEP